MKRALPKAMCDYLEEQGACCKPSTVAGYHLTLGCFDRYLKEALPKNPIRSLTKKHLRNYLTHLCNRDLAPYTKINYLLSVKKYLAWESDRGTLKEDLLEVLDRKHLPKVPDYLPRPLSPENDRLLQNILWKSDSPYAPLFLLLRHTGMRISELINLPKDCVVTDGRDEKYLKVPLGKMNNERLVPLTEGDLALIEKIRTSPPPLKSKRWNPNRLIGLQGPVSGVYPLLALQFKKLVGEMTDQNKPVTFHRLRHTYATTLLTGGVGLVSLMKLLGHRRIEMTLRYAKVTPSHLRDEYLKAVRILEDQAAITKIQRIGGATTGYLHPSEILLQVGSFLNKTNTVPTVQKKNLLLRLKRFADDLSKIRFSRKFTIRPSREDQMSQWAG